MSETERINCNPRCHKAARVFLPLRSKSCGKGALVGVILYVIFIIISVAIGACAAASAYDYYAAVLL